MRSIFAILISTQLFLICFISTISYSENVNGLGVEFTSDSLEIKQNGNIMIATGNVIIKSKNREIIAEKIEYNKQKDKGIATGNVIIKEKDGSKYHAEKIILENEFKNISASLLFGTLADKSNLKAKTFVKKENDVSFFQEGSYTACDCDFKKGETPVWELSTKLTKHDPKTKTIYHNKVVMKLLSFPVFYIPYLEQPDWTVKRRSGFLTPTIGYSKQNHFETSIPYYLATKDKTWDMTYTAHYKGKSGHANQFNFRKQFETSFLDSDLYFGNLDTNKQKDDDVFGFIYNFDSKIKNWKLSSEAKYSDQDTFMKRYNFDGSTEYKSFIKAEKVSENKISDIEIYNIESLEEGVNSQNEPFMAPNISHHKFISNEFLNYEVKLNAHQIVDDERYDIQRWTGSTEIHKSLNFKNYIVDFDGGTGLDLYNINGRPAHDSNDNRYIDKLSLGVGLSASTEFINSFKNFDVFIEPKIQITSMHATDRTEEIPNRDSSNYRIDSSNLFLLNHFQGRDNIQNNQRVNAGIDTLISSDNFGDLTFFIGQSQRIGGSEKGLINTFDRQSDFITELDWQFSKDHSLNLNSLLDNHSLKNNYSNISLNGDLYGINYSTSYRSIKDKLVSDNKDREELKIGLNKNYKNWNFGYNNILDFSNDNEELVSEEIVVDYLSDFLIQNCLSINLTYKETGGSPDRDIKPSNSVYLTFKFKNLGDEIK